MVKAKDNISLKTFGIAISIIIGLGTLGIFTSRADVQDTVKEAIESNDTVDDGKYFEKEAGVTLQANVENMKDDVEEIKSDVKDMKDQMTQQYILLEKINSKLEDSP